MSKLKNIEDRYNIFEEILHNFGNYLSDKAAALLERISPSHKAVTKELTIEPKDKSSIPVFIDATRAKNFVEAPKGKPCRSAYPDGKIVTTDKNGTTHVILPTNATAIQYNSTFGAGFKMPEPVYHVKQNAKLSKRDKKALNDGFKKILHEDADDKESAVKIVQVDLGGNMLLSMNPAQLKTFIQTGHSLGKAMQEDIPVKQKAKKNVADVVDAKPKTEDSIPVQEAPDVNVMLISQQQGGVGFRVQL
jgi:hypothetical protein